MSKVQLPSEINEKVSVLHQMYLDSTLPSDNQIFQDILSKVDGTSLRSLKVYKKEHNWKRAVDKSKITRYGNLPKRDGKKIKKPRPHVKVLKGSNQHQKRVAIPQPVPGLVTPDHIEYIKRHSGYSEEDRKAILHGVCQVFAFGEFSFLQCCVMYGVSIGWVTSWMVKSPVYMEEFRTAQLNAKFVQKLTYESYSHELRIKKLAGYKIITSMMISNLRALADGTWFEQPIKKITRESEYVGDKWDILAADDKAGKLESEIALRAGAQVSSQQVEEMSDYELAREALRLGKEFGGNIEI